MIEIRDKQILIDGKPQLIACGEIHYFRLKRDAWQDRIDKLKAAGCNAVASYIPWLCHEPVEGEFDLDGNTRPELALGAFIDLCRDNDLYFLARPGPFIMAEMKNEGVPFWVYDKYPDCMPVSWDNKPVTTRTLDYLAPGFLDASRRWYQAVMAMIAPRLHPNGGNIIAVQLDNEIGMLAWVTNQPDLTDQLLDDFAAWIGRRYGAEIMRERYPFELNISETRNTAIRSPGEPYATALMRDLGYYMRDRFARYVATLRGYAEEFGVRDVPFVINIHGTDAGRGIPFPIGISQLYEAYTQAPGYLSGSDHYLGDLDANNFQDLYMINAFMNAVHLPDQPLTSVEFEAGNGDYGETYGGRYDPSAVDFKIRMCVAQGNRLLNYYLFSGGINYRLDSPVNDGNDRIAFTGERHGFAAPVNPEGELNYTYAPLASATGAIMAVGSTLATMQEQHDGVAFGFIPDYYMTESKYPSSEHMREIVANLEANRGPGAWEILARAMLLGGYRFSAVDIQNRPFKPEETPVLVLGTARYMDDAIQQRLVEYLRAGGGLLLYGEVPLFDMEGHACTILTEALGLTPTTTRHASAHYFLSLVAEGWVAPRPEVRTHFVQGLQQSRGDVLLRVYGSDDACGFDIPVGDGRAIVFTTAYRCDIPLFRSALERLGATAALRHNCPDYGIWMTSSSNDGGERFVHILNLDGFGKKTQVLERGQALFGGRSIELERKAGIMLPLNVRVGDVRIVWATVEIARVERDAITFRLTQQQDVIALNTARQIIVSDDFTVDQQGDITLIVSCRPACHADRLTIRFLPSG